MRLIFSPVGNYLVVALVAIGLLVLLRFGPSHDRLSRRRRKVLLVLRVLVVLLVALAMLRPTLVHSQIVKQSATVVVLADRSRSMQVADAAGKETRWEVLKSILAANQVALQNLQADFDVQLYTFDAELHPLDLHARPLELGSLPEGRQTAIGAVLEDVLRHEAGKRLAGIILISDGAQRAIAPRDVPPQVPARRLADLGYPLFAVPLGQARGLGQARDVAIEDLRVPQYVYVKNQLDAAATVRIEGFVNQSVLAQLLAEDAAGKMLPVASAKLEARQDGQRLPLELSYAPQIPGEQKITLKLPELPGELVTTNNHMSTFVTVLKGGLNVLYVEGLPRVEEKFIRRALDSSPDIKVDYVRLDARKKETRPPDLAERFKPGKYDVYIFGDVDSQAFSPDELTDLAAAINRGAGFIMLGGLHSFGAGGYGRTALADVLPVVFDRFERQNFDEPIRSDLQERGPLAIKPTAIGSLQTLMLLAARDKNASVWAELPPLDGANRFRQLKPGAQVLATGPRGMPLLVAKDYGNGRVLAFAGDSTWRWWLRGFAAVHKRFWRQTVLWLARKDQSAEGSVWVALEHRRFNPGARVEFTVGARGADGEPITDATFDVSVEQPQGGRIEPRLRRQDNAWLGTFLDAQHSGDYVIRVQASTRGQTIGSSQARFLVFDQDLEMENPAADRGAMENLAAITSGKTVAPEMLGDLLEELKHSARNFEVETQVRETLWDTWPFFLTTIGLLIAEWFLRKRWGLV
ncbi:MAG TPA: glutamine amidotransferase [Pirellulales bacterium]